MTHSCNHCKTEFRQRRRNQFYCSQSCRQLAYVTRKYSCNQTASSQENKAGIDLMGLLGNIQPEKLIQILAAVNNQSMTDKLTDKAEKPVNTHNTSQNPSQNVNDGFAKKQKKDQTFIKKANETAESTQYNETEIVAKDVFDLMLLHKFTIPIPPKGYVRLLFPNWSNKEWGLSQYVNEKMLEIFKRLRLASRNKIISHRELCSCYDQIREFCDGSIAYCLPEDYPFKQFLRFLMIRLLPLMEDAKKKKRIKFKISEELDEMFTILNIQLRTQE